MIIVRVNTDDKIVRRLTNIFPSESGDDRIRMAVVEVYADIECVIVIENTYARRFRGRRPFLRITLNKICCLRGILPACLAELSINDNQLGCSNRMDIGWSDVNRITCLRINNCRNKSQQENDFHLCAVHSMLLRF